MNNKTLIISLIQQDLKHSQLVYGLDNIGLDGSEVHFLEIMEIVAKLMNVPNGEVNDDWGKMYTEFMKESVGFEITSKGEALKPFAKVCYAQLKSLLKNEFT
jgi:hypothetical protein